MRIRATNTPRMPSTGQRLLATFALTLSSCTVGPDYEEPKIETPTSWLSGESAPSPAIDSWWTLLSDPTLVALIEQAQAGNRDLAASLLRIEAARAARAVARGDWAPNVDGIGEYQRSRPSARGFEAPAPTPSPTPPGAEPAKPETPSVSNRNLTSVGIDASWELDVFGRIRRSVESADADLTSTIEDSRDLEVVLLSDVARTYFEIVTLRERIAIARANAATQEQTLELTKSRNRAEISTALDVSQAESNLALTRAEIPSLVAAHDAALFRLALLLGLPPSEIGPMVPTEALPEAPRLEGLATPADMLSRRPDVRAAERRFAAQVARVGVATADLYPRFSLTGGYGYESQDGSATLDSESRTFFIGPSFRWNLFDGGRIRNSIAREDALAKESRTRYEAVVLRALMEVETEWSAYRNETARTAELAHAARAAADAANRVRDLYREGLSDFQNVLDAERVLFRVQDLHATSRGIAIDRWVSIYRSLGGGVPQRASP